METNHLYAPDMETTFYGRILQDIMKRDGFSANIIENYNNEVINKIRELILNTKIPVANGKVSFENVEYEKPYEHVGGKKEPLYPAIARAKTTPYFASIEADMVFTPSPMGVDPITGKPIEVEVQGETRKRMVLGSIPAMLGSKLCWLNKEGATEAEEREERTRLGECPNDPLGYFIIKSERVIVTQENLRNSVFYIYSDKDSVVDARITCPTQQGTTIVEISINKHSCVRVNLQHLNKKDFDGLPVFLLFKLLGFSPEQALEKIYSFIKPEYRVRISYAVQPSIAEFQAIPTDVMEGYINYVLRIREKNDVNKVIREENILPDIQNELFSNISDMDLKITHLSMYCAKMLEYMIGERKLDDRDSWANKQLITGGFSITKLFKVIWWSMMSEIKRKSELMNGLNAVRSIYMSSRIQDNFVTAFGPSGWGLMKHIKKENITDSLKRETPLSVYSQLSHVNTPTSRQSKTPEIRAVHPSQLGYICLYESPEGDTIGLVKSLACTCYISLERDANLFLLMLKEGGSLYDYTSKDKIKDEQVPLLVNGIIRAWCIPSEVIPILRDMRRNGIVHKDACLFHNIKDNTVEIYCDGGRPTRPLFTVNPDNHQLEVINKGLESASVDTLIREGCIEYIDAREQEYILLSQSFDELQAQRLKFMIGEKFRNYSHCEIDPFAIFSISASLVPMANRQAGPRTSFQASMFKQALGQFHSNEHRRFDTSFKMIYYPTKAIFQNDSEEVAGLNYMPTGTTLQVAIYAHPDTQEDAILFKEEAIKYGSIFDMAKKITITSVAKSNNVYNEVFERPALVPGEPEGKYAHIDENGLPKLDAFIRQGDCIIGKVRKFPKDGRIESIPEYAAIGVEGYVDRILITQNPDGYPVVRVKMRKNRKYIPGDKLACGLPDHSVLTSNRGWVQITDVRVDDKVATLNEKQELEYQNPTAIHHYTYKGPMYSIKGQQIDQVVTPEHRMYIKKRDKKEFELDTVQNVFGKRVNYKKNAINTNPDKEFFTMPSETYYYYSELKTDPARDIPMDAWLTYFGIWIGDGYASEKGCAIAANKPRVKEVLDKSEPLLGVKFMKRPNESWDINKGQFSMYFSRLSVGAANKYLPEWCFELSERQSRVLVEGLMLSDGHKLKEGGAYRYYTSSPQLAQDIQRLCLHAGWSANVYKRSEAGYSATKKDGEVITSNYPNYAVAINRTKNEPQMNHGHSKSQDGQEEKIIDYDGTVHCITVPNGIFYIQRNGITSWTGNSRYSQKGTVSKVVPARFLPRIADGPNKGMVPDIFINPHGQPSRMTINKIFEIKTTKAALIAGRYINSTTFRNFEEEMAFAEKTLGDYGFDIHGKENFEMPNGTPVKNKIFCGPCYYQALRHHVSDKIQMRARGGIKPDTRQPVSGRAKEGGLRVGEMERDALISHGSSSLLRERMCDESDAFNLPICAPCGTIAITNHITGVYTCKLCGDKAKFGIIRIPYATKLLLHYLNASGIHMTFKTENMFGEITRPEENYLK